MTINRRDFMAASVAGAALLNEGVKAFAAPAGNIQVGIDTTKAGAPVSPFIFGGYLEPATTRVWAEMLTVADPRPRHTFVFQRRTPCLSSNKCARKCSR